MGFVLELPGVGRATRCDLAKSHTPSPLRFVWHHIYPQECGGKTVPENLVQCCDSCHYGTHVLLYQMAKNGGQLTTLKGYARTTRARYAQQGYAAAAAADTIAKIPNEGGGVFA